MKEMLDSITYRGHRIDLWGRGPESFVSVTDPDGIPLGESERVWLGYGAPAPGVMLVGCDRIDAALTPAAAL